MARRVPDPVGVLAGVPGMRLGGIFRWRGVAVFAVASTLGFVCSDRCLRPGRSATRTGPAPARSSPSTTSPT